MRVKTIKSSRLKIVPFSKKYLTQQYVNWLNDPEVVRYSERRHRHHTLESCQEYWDSFKGTPSNLWAVVLLSNGQHIGNMATWKDIHDNKVDIGILIGEKKIWGKGYGTEMWKAMCNYLFKEEKIRKITAGTMAVNEGMLKIMRKTNMIPDGRRKRHCIWEGKEIDGVHAALFRDNWKGI
ncbi:hypothetical protein ES703_103669 [subsurface metagenome]